MKEKNTWMDRMDAGRDALGEKLAAREIEIPTELISGGFFFAFAIIIYLVMPSQVAVSDSDVVNGRAFPTLLAALMLLFSIVLLIQEFIKVKIKKQPPTTRKVNLLVEIKALVILGILIFTYVICRVTNLFAVGACFCCLGFLIYFRCRKVSYYVITLTMAVLIWVAFRFGLNVNF